MVFIGNGMSLSRRRHEKLMKVVGITSKDSSSNAKKKIKNTVTFKLACFF